MFIPVEKRIRNRNGNCVWCAVETVFNGAAGLEEFRGLTARAIKAGWHGADQQHVAGYFQRAVKDGLVPEGVKLRTGRTYGFFKEAIEHGTGAVIFVPGHALVCVGIDEESARIIDNNGPPEVQVWSRRRFDQQVHWGCFPELPECLRPRTPYNPTQPRPNLPPPSDKPKPPEPKPEQPKPQPPSTTAVDLDKLAELIISKLPKPKDGVDGKPGPAGERGPAGLDGKAGPAGPPAVIDHGKLAAELSKLLPDHSIEINSLRQEITVLRNQINVTQPVNQTPLYRERIVPDK